MAPAHRNPRRPAGEVRHEIVVFSLAQESACDECGVQLRRGAFLRREEEQRGLCMECAGLGDLLFLRSGDAALTRRAGSHSPARVIAVRFARARKRYERIGILVTEEALERAEAECLEDADVRERKRAREALRRADHDADYVKLFAARVRELYPNCPDGQASAIAHWTCRKRSGRIGRSAAAKALDERAVELAVRAHVRHVHTDYEERLFRGEDRSAAREAVAGDILDVLEAWNRRTGV